MTSELENYANGLIFLFAIISLTIMIVTLIAFAVIDMNTAHGDDTEDKGKSWIETMLQRVEEWNMQKAMNETLEMSERFDCEFDESLCVLGIPDPDFNDTAYNSKAACFNSLEDYFKFRLEHDDDENYMVMYPCPDRDSILNQTVPKDESGK